MPDHPNGPNPNPSGPDPTGCGGTGQHACNPEPSIVIDGVKYWTEEQMTAQSKMNYAKGRAEATA
jgi:hypothetical protein